MFKMSSLVETIRSHFIDGALAQGGSWGGHACSNSVSFETHALEGSLWISLSIFLYFILDVEGCVQQLKAKALKFNSTETAWRPLEICLGIVHLSMFAILVYLKYETKAMIYLFQPCHMVLLFQGIALYKGGDRAVVLAVLLLPWSVGTGLAMVFPDTNGLGFAELIFYWAEHYLIQIIPIYLLTRSNFVAFKLVSLRSVLTGVWIMQLTHWVFFEPLDVVTQVNVEFMLCPTDAMKAIMELVPTWLAYPSYRTLATIAISVGAIICSYIYISVTFLFAACFYKNHKKD
eukprot:Colp12_sorted_trinity150504_noHs@26087